MKTFEDRENKIVHSINCSIRSEKIHQRGDDIHMMLLCMLRHEGKEQDLIGSVNRHEDKVNSKGGKINKYDYLLSAGT